MNEELRRLIVVFTMAAALSIAFMELNSRVGKPAAKFISYVMMWLSLGLAVAALGRVVAEVW